MSDFLGWESNYNPWDLDELFYEGELYHYTDKLGYEGILNPSYEKFPEDCICLRFTRIDQMRKNDRKERRHIRDTVKLAAQRLLSTEQISEDFSKKVQKFHSKDKGHSFVPTGKVAFQFQEQLPALRLRYGQIDCFVACFSKNPDNKYIQTEFNAPYRVAFTPAFSNPNNPQYSPHIPQLYRSIYPFKNFPACGVLSYKIGQVIYEDNQKINLIEKELLNISHSPECDIPYHLQILYTLYDAFFKSAEYCQEDEVRFVIWCPKTIRAENGEDGWIKFDKIQNEIRKEYLYLPIDRLFFAGGDFRA